jgi:hypothetical protein
MRATIGQWYEEHESGDQFKVITLDEGAVEVQYLDGDVGGFEADEWKQLALMRIAAPEDWSGALEPVQDGDGGYDPESFDPPEDQRPVTGFEQEQVLLPDEGAVRKARGPSL